VTLNEAREALQLTESADAADIRRAFKRLALRFHPDRNPEHAEAAARFRRVLLAYEVLTGQRAPTLGSQAAPAASSRVAWREPDKRAPWEVPSVEVLPLESADGEPLHYPTAEEIRNLSNDETHPVRMMNRLALIFVGIVVLWAVLAALGPPRPAPLDPLNEKLQRGLGKPW
jgi:hypothetical protein